MSELHQIPVFQGLPDGELQWLLDRGSEETLRTKKFFFREGGPAERFYIVLDGELQVTRTIDGQEMVESSDVLLAIRDRTPGATVTVTFDRNGASSEVTVTLEERPAGL